MSALNSVRQQPANVGMSFIRTRHSADDGLPAAVFIVVTLSFGIFETFGESWGEGNRIGRRIPSPSA